MPGKRKERAAALALASVFALVACRDPEPIAAARVYVSNEDDGTISVIDSEQARVVATIPVGKRPRGMALSADRRQLFVALSGSPKAPPGIDESTLPPADRAQDGIGVVDLAALRLVRILESGQDPESFDLAGDALVVSNEETAEAAIVDVATGAVRARVPVGGEPEGVTTAPDGTTWVTSEADDRIDVLAVRRGAAPTAVATIAVGRRPRAIAFSADGARAYVSNELGASVTVIDARTHTVVKTIALPASGAMQARPMGLARARAGDRLFVSTGRTGSVVQIAMDRDEVTGAIDGVGARPWGIAIAPDGRVYTANGPSNDVSVIDPERGEVVTRIAAGASPWGVVVDR
jgi:YVTN family beta-propeller protein